LAVLVASSTTIGVAITAAPAGAAILKYTDPTISGPEGITNGPDGALWFTNAANASIGRITTSGAVTNFTDPSIGQPVSITLGPDGALWFVNYTKNSIGRITTGGVVTSYLDATISNPDSIVAGSDGALWFANVTNNSIGRITTSGAVTNFTSPAHIAEPLNITSGPDGALWFVNRGNNSIGRITTAGVATSYSDPSINNSWGIAVGPDGALWFTNQGNNSIGRITTGGAVTNFTDPSMSLPTGIASGPDGAVWFTNQTGATSIGRITTGGVVTSFSDPSLSNPVDIVTGPDGALWFGNVTGNSIGQLTLGTGTAPGAPSITKVTAGDRQVSVSFAPGASGSSATSGYVASCDPVGGGDGQSRSGAGSPIVVTGLTNGTGYRCTVIAFNGSGNSPPSTPSAVVTPAEVTAHCTDKTVCTAAIPSTPSESAPGQDVHVSGTPSASIGSISVSTSLGRLNCPSVGSGRVPITNLTDTGFSARTRLSVTATLRITAATSTERVCFNSNVPFLSEASPKVKKAGTGLLLDCTQVANVAPCVTSSSEVGSNVVVKFVVPGGDPRFYITLPKGRLAWLAGPGIAKIDKTYTAQIRAVGGRAPYHWKISSGRPPPRLSINATTGLISGTPTRKGTFGFTVQATDSSTPAQTAPLNVPITVK
jgi:virginiamycin B lyase